MKKFMVNSDWMLMVSSNNKEIRMNFLELPRTPIVGNDDIEIIISNNHLQINGDDGYGSIADLKYILRNKGFIGPCFEGWMPITTGKWNIVEMFLLFFRGVNFFAYKRAVQNTSKIIGEESWDFMSQEEKDKMTMEVYNLYCQE